MHKRVLILARNGSLPNCASTMKAVILAGGLGTRISEKPISLKLMVEIGGKPILAYLKIYSTGINESSSAVATKVM